MEVVAAGQGNSAWSIGNASRRSEGNHLDMRRRSRYLRPYRRSSMPGEGFRDRRSNSDRLRFDVEPSCTPEALIFVKEPWKRKPPLPLPIRVLLFGLFAFLAMASAGFPFEGLRKRDDAFHEAAMNGDVAEVKRFLDAGKDPDAPGLDPKDGRGGALLGALMLSHYDVADLLVRRGADVNRKDDGKSLLYRLARENYADAYKWLIEHGATTDPAAEALLRLPSENRFRLPQAQVRP